MSQAIKLTRICITATGRTPAELMMCADRALLESRFVELRLDFVSNPVEAVALIPRLLDGGGHAILQATCRRSPNGGRFSGSVAAQVRLLEQAVAAGCRVIDLEIESAESVGVEAVARLRQIAKVILSFHDFRSTPRLAPIARRMRRFPADYYKIVPTATQQSHNCVVLDLLSSFSENARAGGKWVGFAMGEVGIPSRILALSRGSAFGYAAPSEDRGSESMLAAPGQLDWSTLHTQYRVERLGRDTAIYGILGCPVGHSIGPAIHNASFRRRRMDAVYMPLLADDLRDFRRAAERYPLAGFSVTIPHKREIVRYTDKIDSWVEMAGAANTIRIRRGRWEAVNTDIDGIRIPLQRRYRLSRGRRLGRAFRAAIVGNGGSARAAVIALQSLGCRNISVVGRDPARVRHLAKQMDAEATTLDALRTEAFDLLIHATPVGMWPNEQQCLLTADHLRAGTVFDLVYNPQETELLKRARAAGCRTISGLEMFLAQAARQFKFWTGVEAPLSQMRRVAVRWLISQSAGTRSMAP
jgi:3-dehydroquinate dehydratase/shikimate dehydrogenase